MHRFRVDSTDAQRDTGAEIAVLDSLIRNGTHLDLRAFTLEYLPDISMMFATLVAVDLSYNCLRVSLISRSSVHATRVPLLWRSCPENSFNALNWNISTYGTIPFPASQRRWANWKHSCFSIYPSVNCMMLCRIGRFFTRSISSDICTE